MRIFVGIFLVFFQLVGSAQSAKELLAADSVVWFGLDFSKAKFSGRFTHAFGIDPNSGNDLINKWIPDWNELFIKEPMNYDIREALKKPKTYYDLKPVSEGNSKIISDSVFNEQLVSYKIAFPELIIPKVIKNYSSEKYKSGLGCVFIVESFNKDALNASVYFVLFEISGNKLIGYKKLNGIPKGAGIRNYWGGALKDIIKQIKNSAYPGIVSKVSQQKK